MSAPANQQQPFSASPIAGTVLPIRRAEELLATLPGVIAARIVASESGTVDEIHVLTTSEVAPKQTVRNVESALIAHLGMRVDHRKISVATTIEAPKAREAREAARESASPRAAPSEAPEEKAATPARVAATPAPEASRAPASRTQPGPEASSPDRAGSSAAGAQPVAGAQPGEDGGDEARRRAETEASVSTFSEVRPGAGRTLLFDSVEVRRSRAGEVTYRVTLSKGAESYIGESGGFENERTRVEQVARAALEAIKEAEGDDRHVTLDGCKVIDAFDRQFAFVGVTAREGREAALLTGSCEIKESPETSAVLAVLDATNRWIARSE